MLERILGDALYASRIAWTWWIESGSRDDIAAQAADIAVPTLVTSFVGMNVGFPLNGSVAGFWVYFALMIVAGLVLYLVFRRKDWV